MKRHTRHLIVMVLAFALSNCQSFKSYPAKNGELPEAASNKQGLHYFLPKARLEIEGKYNDIKGTDGKTVVRREYVVAMKKYHVADPDAPVFAEITENVMYDEDSVLSVKDGLLQSANAKPEDKTGDIIVTLVGTVIDVAKAAGGAPGLKLFSKSLIPNIEKPKKPVTAFLVDFDPADSDALREAETIMNRAGFSLTLTGKKSKSANSGPGKKDGTVADFKDGLAFRRPTALVAQVALNHEAYEYQNEMEDKEEKVKGPDGVETTVKKSVLKTPSAGAQMYRASFTVPDTTPNMVAYVPVKRGFMTKRQTDVTFENGIPTKFDLKAPSPVLGFVKLPATIAKMAADAVPTLVKINNDSDKGQLTRETDLIKAQTDLIKAQNELNSLKAATP
jgi:hypothetical protein